jgi:uncharacterized protein (DUF983 family)
MPIIRWQPDRKPAPSRWPVPPVSVALGRGIAGRCPACGATHLFSGFLRLVRACTACGAPLGSARADDAPPYFVVLITGHIIIPLLLITQRMSSLSDLVLSAIFVPLTALVALGLLRPVKGGVVAMLLAMGMLDDMPRC